MHLDGRQYPNDEHRPERIGHAEIDWLHRDCEGRGGHFVDAEPKPVRVEVGADDGIPAGAIVADPYEERPSVAVCEARGLGCQLTCSVILGTVTQRGECASGREVRRRWRHYQIGGTPGAKSEGARELVNAAMPDPAGC